MASAGEQMIGSSCMLKLVLITLGMPVRFLYSLRTLWKLGLVSAETSCGRAVPSTWTAAGQCSRIHGVQSKVIVMKRAANSAPSMFW